MAKIRKGDLVEIITGPKMKNDKQYRGAQGTVLEVLVKEQRVIVEGLNLTTRHTRVGQTQRGSKTGGIEHIEAPIHISNVALVDPATKKPARVGFEEKTVTKDGEKKVVRERVFKPSRRADKPAAKKTTAAKTTKKDTAAKAESTTKDAE
ncbi:50S ribosomal protein L24 [Pseudoclavibacter triregionum]|nr:50S ribosomal protein L24 [Pseudoclavibacter triregionum]